MENAIGMMIVLMLLAVLAWGLVIRRNAIEQDKHREETLRGEVSDLRKLLMNFLLHRLYNAAYLNELSESKLDLNELRNNLRENRRRLDAELLDFLSHPVISAAEVDYALKSGDTRAWADTIEKYAEFSSALDRLPKDKQDLVRKYITGAFLRKVAPTQVADALIKVT